MNIVIFDKGRRIGGCQYKPKYIHYSHAHQPPLIAIGYVLEKCFFEECAKKKVAFSDTGRMTVLDFASTQKDYIVYNEFSQDDRNTTCEFDQVNFNELVTTMRPFFQARKERNLFNESW
jgi:hypothetical protein